LYLSKEESVMELLRDLRYAVRMMLRAPVITAVALVSLAVGIGANTTIFSMINAVFLRGLPVADPERLVVLYGTDSRQGQQGNFMPISRLNYLDFRDRNEVFSDLVDVAFSGASLTRPGGEAEQVGIQMVSGSYFQTLGVKPAAGRFFLPQEDEVPARDPVAVLSYQTFQQNFGADPAVVGSTVGLNGHPFTVIGVAPRGFTGTFTFGNPDLWVPIMMYPSLMPANLLDNFLDRRALFTFVFGRLKPGVSVSQAEASLQVIGRSLAAEYPDDNGTRNVGLLPLNQASIPPAQRDNFVRAGAMLMALVGLVLLIACANVANLLLGRAMARRKEIAIRLSIGASRSRLIRQLIAESLLLGLMAAALGLALAYWGRQLLWAMAPPFLANAPLDLSFDGRVLLFTLAVALATGLVFGIAPALQATRPQVVDELKQGTPKAGGGLRLLSGRNLLVVAQVALCLVALISSGLFLRSLGNATKIDPGFEVDHLALMTVNAGALGFTRPQAEQYFDQVLERARSVPGVRSAALATDVPLLFGGFARTVFVEGRDPKGENTGILTPVDPVGEGYFQTLGIPLLKGRDFTPQDREDAPYVAIFNEAAVKRFWPGEDALGQRFRFFGEDWILEVVGIAADSKIGAIGEEPQAQIYLPRWQHFGPAVALFVRTEGSPAPVLATVRDQVRQLEPGMPINNVQAMPDVLRDSVWQARMAAKLFGFLGALALLLALAGIYGVMSYAVSQRQREIGIRVALGARPQSVVSMLLGRGMVVVAVGLVIGLVVAALLGRAVEALLYGLSGTDLVTFAATTVILAGVAFVATLVPARRATAVDPVAVLKADR
jgi:putative ABC transport system permease protein